LKERLIFTVPLDLLTLFLLFFYLFLIFFAVEPYTPNMGKKCGRVKPLSVFLLATTLSFQIIARQKMLKKC